LLKNYFIGQNMSFFFQVVVVCFMALLQFDKRLVLTACLWLVLQDQNVLRAQLCVSGGKGQCIKYLILATVSSSHYYVRETLVFETTSSSRNNDVGLLFAKSDCRAGKMFSISKFLSATRTRFCLASLACRGQGTTLPHSCILLPGRQESAP
jgi:hypothetical protein